MFKKLFKRKEKKEIGNIVFYKEVVPLFSSNPPISNKTLLLVKNIENSIGFGQELNSFGSQASKFYYRKDKVLTQRGNPISAKDKNLKKLESDKEFEKNGFKEGQIYSFEGLGYLENLSDDKIVVCVTDQLVIFKTMKDRLSFYKYEELEGLKDTGKLKLIS